MQSEDSTYQASSSSTSSLLTLLFLFVTSIQLCDYLCQARCLHMFQFFSLMIHKQLADTGSVSYGKCLQQFPKQNAFSTQHPHLEACINLHMQHIMLKCIFSGPKRSISLISQCYTAQLTGTKLNNLKCLSKIQSVLCISWLVCIPITEKDNMHPETIIPTHLVLWQHLPNT